MCDRPVASGQAVTTVKSAQFFSDKSFRQSSLLVERFIYDIRRHQSAKDMAPTHTNSRPNKMSVGAIGLFVSFVIIESGCLITPLSAG